MSQYAYSLTMFDGTASKGVLTASGGATPTATSITHNVNSIRPLGNFASQIEVTGDGSVSLELFISINGDDFVSYGELFTDATKTDGPNLDGKQLDSHGMAVCMQFYVVATSTDAANAVTVKHWLGVQ